MKRLFLLIFPLLFLAAFNTTQPTNSPQQNDVPQESSPSSAQTDENQEDYDTTDLFGEETELPE